MQALPQNAGEWLARLLFPFKVYVVVAYPFYRIFRMFCPLPFLGTNVSDGTLDTLVQWFLLCVLVLIVGSTIQLVVSERRDALRTLAFAFAPIVVIVLLHLV